MDDPLEVRVQLEHGVALARIEDAAIAAEVLPLQSGRVALYLEAQPVTLRAVALPEELWHAATALLSVDAEQGWRSVRLYGPDGAAVYDHDFGRLGTGEWTDRRQSWFRDVFGDATSGWSGFLAGPETSWRGGELYATLQRGRNGAGIVIGGDGYGEGMLLLVRPVHRDFMWWQLREGGWYGPVAGGAYLRPWYSALKDLLRLLLKPYFAALLLGSAVVLVGALLRAGPFSLREKVRMRAARREGVAEVTAQAAPSPQPSPRGRGGETNPSPRGGKGLSAAALPLAVSLAVATLGITAYVADVLLQRMPHVQDSVAYYFQAQIFAMGRIWADLPPLPDFFAHEFVLQHDGRWFGKYPPGFPLILAAGVVAGLPWLVNPLLAAVTSLATYGVGVRTAGRATGLLAALLLLLSPFFLFLSGSFMAHTAGLAFTMLFALAYARERPLLAGLALGMSATVRPYTALLLALPFGVDLLLRLRSDPRATLRFGVLMALGLAPPLALFVGWNWVMAGGPTANTMELWWPTDKLGFGADKGLSGHTPLNGLYNSLRNLNELSRHAFGWPALFTFLFALVPFASGRATRAEVLWLASWFCLMFGYFFWWADGVMYGPRFYLEAMGFVALLTARGALLLGPLLGPVLLGALLLFNGFFYLPVQAPLLRGYNFVSRDSLDAVARAGVKNAVVFVDPGPVAEWWNYGMVFSANTPRLDTDVIYARDLGPRNRDLMELFPDRNFYRLRKTVVEPIEADNG
jgi:hypothetical protein